MANKEYTLQMSDGIETTVLLSDEDAKARGLTKGKSVEPAEKQADPADKGFVAANKARTSDQSAKKSSGGSK